MPAVSRRSSPPTPDLAPAARTRRWLALDLLRGLAVVLMIQGHTFTALLKPTAYTGAWSRWHSLLHGLTAPMFLFGGGLAYGFVVMRSVQPKLWRRLVRRGLMLLALGYILQLPKAPPSVWLHDPAVLANALRVGPLQLIGACLLLCELVRALTRTRLQLTAALCVQAVAITLLAPLVWRAHASLGSLLPLGTWLDGYAGSLFPFFPWSVFFLLGVALSFGVLRVLESSRRSQLLAACWSFMAGGLACVAAYVAFLRGHVLESWYGPHELWHTSPLYVVFRAGAVMALLGLLWILAPLLERRWSQTGRFETLLTAVAQNSLVAYVVHLLVLYGTPFTLGLVHNGQTLDIPEACLVSGLLIAFTLAAVLLWQRLPSLRPFYSSARRSA